MFGTVYTIYQIISLPKGANFSLFPVLESKKNVLTCLLKC